MLDLQLLRTNPHEVARQLKRRGFHFDVSEFLSLEDRRKHLQVETELLQNERNNRSREIGQAKSSGQDISSMREEMTKLSQTLSEKKEALEEIFGALDTLLLSLPNLPDASVPDGRDDSENVEMRRFGEIPRFDFEPKSHDVLGEALGQMDFSLASKITGSRFVVMKRGLVALHRALTQFMIDTHVTQHGYEEIYVPYIVNEDSVKGTGQLAKFSEDLFHIKGDGNYFLIPTAEIPVTNTVRDVILEESVLPLRYVCHTPCFRSEAGSYGRDTKGMIRQHQFEKVELVWIVKPEDSFDALEKLTEHAETILKKLGLPYRVVSLCTGDLGFSSTKTYDLEVWLPSQNAYREISSCSNMTSFQARRMKARLRDKDAEIHLTHTLNGSGLAVGRTLVAIMENYQDKDGNIHIPEVLKPYMRGIEIIARD